MRVVVYDDEATSIGALSVSNPIGPATVDARSTMSCADRLLDFRATKQALAKLVFCVEGPDKDSDRGSTHVPLFRPERPNGTCLVRFVYARRGRASVW